MIFTNTNFTVVAVVGLNKYLSEVTYPTLREMLEDEVIHINGNSIHVTSIEVTKNDHTIYFYGDVIN